MLKSIFIVLYGVFGGVVRGKKACACNDLIWEYNSNGPGDLAYCSFKVLLGAVLYSQLLSMGSLYYLNMNYSL